MRYTAAILEDRIATVQTLAARAGLIYVQPHNRARYDGLSLYWANGTVRLHATIEGTTGAADIGSAYGTREVGRYLDGMIQALNSITRNG